MSEEQASVNMPTIGRIVHFKPNVNDNHNFKNAPLGHMYPAIVIGSVKDSTMVTLSVHTDNEEKPVVLKTNVSYESSVYLETGQEYWTWPSY